MAARWDSFVLAVAVVGLIMISSSSTAVRTSSFVRSSSLSPDMPLDSDVFRVPPGYNAPQQVHITQGDHEGKGVIVSWVTPDEPGSNTVLYWAENSTLKQQAHGIVLTYNYFNYTSNYIHHCTIEDLEFDTKYYYEVGVGNTTRQFSFTTPPGVGPDVPYTFGIIGDLGQTYDSNRTLTHYELNPIKGQTVLFVGDLSYADDYPFHDNNRWDTWGRFIERNAAYQPWIWSYGQQEIMKLILLLNLVKLYPSSPLQTVFIYHTEHRIVLLLFGTLLEELQHISLSCPLTLLLGNTRLNTNGWKRSSQKSTEARHHGLLFSCIVLYTIVMYTIIWKENL